VTICSYRKENPEREEKPLAYNPIVGMSSLGQAVAPPISETSTQKWFIIGKKNDDFLTAGLRMSGSLTQIFHEMSICGSEKKLFYQKIKFFIWKNRLRLLDDSNNSNMCFQ
jgi:hypothetical protein